MAPMRRRQTGSVLMLMPTLTDEGETAGGPPWSPAGIHRVCCAQRKMRTCHCLGSRFAALRGPHRSGAPRPAQAGRERRSDLRP